MRERMVEESLSNTSRYQRLCHRLVPTPRPRHLKYFPIPPNPTFHRPQIPMDLLRQILNFSLFAILLCFLTKLLLPAPSIHRLLQILLKCDAEISVPTPTPNFQSNSSRAESPPPEFRRDEDHASPGEGPLINADPSARASEEIPFAGLLEKYMDEHGREDGENSRAERAISGAVENNLNHEIEESDSKYKEDDWEGIERTELETCFGAAVVYVGSSRNAGDLRSEVKKKLYGLHKIATQGPCCHAQPMPFRLSARAKWKAWEELGKMSPEEGMAAYIDLLSANIPGWRAHPHFTKSGP